MRMAQTIGWGLVGSATTMLVRNATRRAMYTDEGRARLPRAARRHNGAGILLVAALAGATLAFADVLKEQRKRNAEGSNQPGFV
jgi:hypothetical protein